MKNIIYFLLSLISVVVISFGAFNTTAYSQEKDVVLAKGNPPLTELMVGKVVVLLDWTLDLKLSQEQQVKISEALIRAWERNDREDIEGALQLVETYDEVKRLNQTEQGKVKGKLKEIILQSIREDPNDELAQMLLQAYQAAHSKPSKKVPQSNSSSTQSNNSSTAAKGKMRVGADGFTGIYRMIRPRAWDINNKGMQSAYWIEYITFLPSGYVYWRLPREGLLYFDPKVAQKAYPDDWGTYEIKNNGEIHILRGPQKRKYVITRNGERLNNPPELGKGSFRPVPVADGLKLEGTYRRHSSDPTITFTADGRFRDEGAFRNFGDMARPDGTIYQDDGKGGSGTYLIEQYTLELRYSDGRIKRFPFLAFPENLAKKPALDSFILFFEDIMKRY